LKNFNAYSQYYDLLYKDKNYKEEINYVQKLINAYSPGSKNILELGCGTGIHASLLNNKGFNVTGIDKSTEMLSIANVKINNRPENSGLKFIEGDLTDFRTGNKYEAIISLFHVMSYMQDESALLKAFETAVFHLNNSGVFIFDCWHGPAVISEKPTNRTKYFEDEKIKVTRESSPEWMEDKKSVNVTFNISVFEKQSNKTEFLSEEHLMRYWFELEIRALLQKSGFQIVKAEEWLTGKPLSENSWNACYIARKQN
jgi:SAM-dependent methyltransferase